MTDLTVEQVQEELKRGIDFYAALDAQILAFLAKLAEVLEAEHDLAPFKRPFAKNARRASIVQTYLLLLRPTDAEVDSEDDHDEDASDDDDANDRTELSFSPDAKLPYVLVQLAGKPSAKAKRAATLPFIQYGTIAVLGRKDGKPLEGGQITMRGAYYGGMFRNRVCNPGRKPPYTHKAKRGGATLLFDEGPTCVAPLGGIRSEADIEDLARHVAALVAG
jgi:hypothetical protein